MKLLRFALFPLVFGVAFAVFAGRDWQRVALGCLFGLLVAAMLDMMPLRDWVYPTDDKTSDDNRD